MLGAVPAIFEIDPVGDYSLRESGQFIGGWHESPADGSSPEGHLHLAFLTDRDWTPAAVCLTQDSSGRVRGQVFGEASIDAVEHQAARTLSLDVDGRGWRAVGDNDPVVRDLQAMFPGFRPVNWSSAYEAAAWSLISTRISMRQGERLKDQMSRELGRDVDIHGHRVFCFPTPDVLARLESFRGLFGRKVDYLNLLGRAALAGELDTETLRAMPAAEALSALRRLKGIGEFGSQLVRLRALSAVDELPTAEPRLLKAVRNAYALDHDPDIVELSRIAERWRPYRMWAAVSLRRTLAEGSMTMSAHRPFPTAGLKSSLRQPRR
jgi:DNA-3-methyladenine glycosylase II